MNMTTTRAANGGAKELLGLDETHSGEFLVGGRTFQLTANPVFGADGARLGTVIEWVDTNVMVTDEHNNVIYMNDALRRLFSETSSDIRKDIPGFNPDSLVGDDVAAAGADRWNLAPARGPKR